MKHFWNIGLLSLALLLSACGGGGAESSGDSGMTSDDSGLTAEQLENGIGPISSLELGEYDAELASAGEETFKIKCSACHKLDERYVGPPLGKVLEERTPAYVMNMILNPEGMLAEHPDAKAMLAEYLTPMANQNLTEEEARAIVEYLRGDAMMDEMEVETSPES